jgi:enoyl-CoA hydratase/carnithine racemase
MHRLLARGGKHGSKQQVKRLLSTSVHGSFNNQIGQIVIDNRPKLNAMTLQMYKDVPAAVKAAKSEAKSEARVCILSGAGDKAFGAGSDISEFPTVRTGAKQAAQYSEYEDSASEALLSLECPLIAKIQGPCYGGALNLALAADLRYASDDATFCVPPAKLGIGYPRSLMNLLIGAVGKTNAKQLLFTAEVVDAERAKAMGLVNVVVPKEQLDAYVDKVAKQITRLAPLTIQSCKMELMSPDDDAELAYKQCYESEDYEEGVRAFLVKGKPSERIPKFQGR